MLYMTLFALLMSYIPIFTFWGTFGPQNTYFQSLTGYQCHVDECELCQNVLIVCASRFIYGLHDFIRVSKVLYTNFFIFGYFWARLGAKKPRRIFYAPLLTEKNGLFSKLTYIGSEKSPATQCYIFVHPPLTLHLVQVT